MIDSFKEFIKEVQDLWGKIGLNQKIALGIVLAVFVGALTFWGSWNSQDDYGLLFKDLDQGDAGEIVNILKSENTPYRIEDGGTAILVPADRVYDLRLRLASQGLPTQEEGWSLFDKTRLGGLSDFVQQINYTRALQSELERSISRLKQIEWARVHIVEAKESVFLDKTQPATASVLIKTRAGAHLGESQIAGITHLIAGAVRGLPPENVTITDYSGKELSRPQNSGDALLASNQLDYRKQVEEHLSARATHMLERVLGPGNAVVTVSADIDFSSSQSREIEYKSDITKSKTETSQETSAPETGAAANANGGTGSSSSNTTREETVEYMPPVPLSETTTSSPGGKVNRLAAAVFVSAGTSKTGPDGKAQPQYVPADAKKLAQYEEIVKNAIGYVEGRDSITISDSQFRDDTQMPQEQLAIIEKQQNNEFIIGIVKAASTALGVLMFMLFARHFLKKTAHQPVEEEEEDEEEQEEEMPLTESVGSLQMTTLPEEEAEEEEEEVPLRQQVVTAVAEDPNRTAQFLRIWMTK